MTEPALLTSPVNTISPKPSSHRSAEAHIYEDILDHLGYDVTVDYGGKLLEDGNTDNFHHIFVYHGNEWSGSLNLFGGMDNESLFRRIDSLSHLDTRVKSVGIDFPEYARLFQERLEKKPLEMWNSVDWTNLKELENCETWNPIVDAWHSFVLGDSHAISMYRRYYNIGSIPFKTLHGAMKVGFQELFEEKFGSDRDITRVEFYFGNIDIRHHLCRQENPWQAAIDLAVRYADEATRFAHENDCEVAVYEPLPIEHPSRKVPKSGWYEGEPFYGSWEERNSARDTFIETLKNLDIELIEWTDGLKNEAGELDFKCMEKPQSVHLSREYYPWWQGLNKKVELEQTGFGTLDSFM